MGGGRVAEAKNSGGPHNYGCGRGCLDVLAVITVAAIGLTIFLAWPYFPTDQAKRQSASLGAVCQTPTRAVASAATYSGSTHPLAVLGDTGAAIKETDAAITRKLSSGDPTSIQLVACVGDAIQVELGGDCGFMFHFNGDAWQSLKCYQDRQTIRVFEPATGRLLWQHMYLGRAHGEGMIREGPLPFEDQLERRRVDWWGVWLDLGFWVDGNCPSFCQQEWPEDVSSTP